MVTNILSGERKVRPTNSSAHIYAYLIVQFHKHNPGLLLGCFHSLNFTLDNVLCLLVCLRADS